MAARRSAGLSLGQLITLTFGFLLASVVIFIFGLWVGRDLAEQRVARERDVARVPVAPPPEAPATMVPVASAPTPLPSPRLVAAPATFTAIVRTTVTTAPLQATRPPATATRASAGLSTATPGGAGGWTVQANATNDTMKAVMLSRQLRSKGYEAFTVTEQIRGVTWYLVRVGRFRERDAAKKLEEKLRREEGLEAAYATQQ